MLAAGVSVFASQALSANVLYALDVNFPPGHAVSNGNYSNVYYNKMANVAVSPQGVYQRYTNGSKTRILNKLATIVDISGSALYTQAWCQNPSGPGGPTVYASQCRYYNTAP